MSLSNSQLTKVIISHTTVLLAIVFTLIGPLSVLADEPPEFLAAALKRRSEIPFGGNFAPTPSWPVFVAVGHGGRILLSRNDGETWDQVFWGHPGSDHGLWATKSIAYSNGIFVVPIGWGAPTAWLASENGVRWRHLTAGEQRIKGVKETAEDPSAMPATWSIAGGKGVFVSGGYMTMAATPDFGKSFTTFSLANFKNDPRPRSLMTHHVNPIYCGDESGRFLALGNDRAKENPVFGNLWASDDLGKTWKWLERGWEVSELYEPKSILTRSSVAERCMDLHGFL